MIQVWNEARIQEHGAHLPASDDAGTTRAASACARIAGPVAESGSRMSHVPTHATPRRTSAAARILPTSP